MRGSWLDLLLVLANVTASLAFFDTISSAFDSLKVYINDVTPYVSEGLKMAQKAERFVDSAIGEECLYECPKFRHVPVPKPGHVKTSNGCGSLDVLFDDSEGSLIHVERGFTKCCDQHDYCYDTCNADKDECDLKFKKCLYGHCKKDMSFLNSKKCKLKAKLFFVTVIGVGCQSYLDAQENACDCIPSKSKQEL